MEKLENLTSALSHIPTPSSSSPASSDESSQSDESSPDPAERERERKAGDGFHTLRIIKDICDRELSEAVRERERKQRLAVPDPTDEDIENSPNFRFVSFFSEWLPFPSKGA